MNHGVQTYKAQSHRSESITRSSYTTNTIVEVRNAQSKPRSISIGIDITHHCTSEMFEAVVRMH